MIDDLEPAGFGPKLLFGAGIGLVAVGRVVRRRRKQNEQSALGEGTR